MSVVPDTAGRAVAASDHLAGLEEDHFWFVGRDALTRSLLDRWGAAEPILDLGCGSGRFAAHLARSGRRVIALDTTPGGFGPAGATVVGDAETLCLHDQSIATVLARDVLEHVDDLAVLRECHRVLRRGGLLVALVPGWPSLWSDRDVRAGHLRRYRRGRLRALVELVGFEVADIRGYQFALLPAMIVSRLVSRIAGPEVIDREEAPGRRVNAVLASVNRIEAAMARWRMPIPPTGSTLVLVAVRR